MLSVSIGPLSLSLERLLLLVALVIALAVGWLFGRRHRISVEPVITQMLLWGVIGARVGFVLLYLQDYLAEPLSIIDIRDGGFLLEAGLLVALAVGLFHGWRNRIIRRPLGAAVAAGALTWAATAGALNLIQVTQTTVPGITFTTLEDETLTLANFAGRPMVVNLWATWCPPCRREMPVLAAAQQRETDVAFIFVNQGESKAVVKDYLQSEQLQLRNVLLDAHLQLSNHMGAQGMPTTLYFDAQGALVDTHMGELSTATLKRGLKSFSTDFVSTDNVSTD